jgi:hypothetical protein
MHDSPRYRDMAAKSLRAAQETCEPHYRKLQLSMAVSWLSLARHNGQSARGLGYGRSRT